MKPSRDCKTKRGEEGKGEVRAMIFGPMDEMEMAAFLSSMKRESAKLNEKKKEIENEIVTVEEYIRLNSCGGHSDSEVPAGNVFRSSDTLHRIWEHSYREYKERLDALCQEALDIAEQEQKIGYVKKCLRMLPSFQRDILELLYVEGMTQKEYAVTNCVSRATVNRNRNIALKNLVVLYNGKFDTGR